ncbi:hypothetical protein EWZ62_00755 [Helicobacter pylori]|nr:hypothetical protein [Helicobacter pylori]
MPIKKGKAIRGYKQGINLACTFLFIQFYSVIILFSVGVFAPITIFHFSKGLRLLFSPNKLNII